MGSLTWIGLFLSLLTLLLISRRSLPFALFAGGVILGFFTLPLREVGRKILGTLSDPSIDLLALAMGIIPMIGGAMKKSGQIDDLVSNLRIGRKALLALSPALMGLLPMPGGALLSSPVVEKGGKGVEKNIKVALNVWFRHLFILIYPLSSALIASAKIAGLGVYMVIPYLLPGFVFALLLGYIFFVRRVRGEISYSDSFSWKRLLPPLGVILVPPALDFTLQRIATLPVKEMATLIAVSASLFLSLAFSRFTLNLKEISRLMKPWNFTFIILGMFIFLHIFQASDAASLIASIPLPPLTLSVIAGFILGLATGRVQLPASIILPVYLATSSFISPILFSVIYISIFFGYVLSPVHPCVSVSCEYFRVQIKDFLRELALPVFIIFAIALALSFLLV